MASVWHKKFKGRSAQEALDAAISDLGWLPKVVSQKSYVVTGPQGGTFHEILVEWTLDQTPPPPPENLPLPEIVPIISTNPSERQPGTFEDWNQAIFVHLFHQSSLVDAEALPGQQRLIYVPDELLEAIHSKKFQGTPGKGKESLKAVVEKMSDSNWASAFKSLVAQEKERIARDFKKGASYIKPPAFVTFLAFFVNCALDVWTGESGDEINEEAMNSAVWLQVNRRLGQNCQVDRQALKTAFGLLERVTGNIDRASFANPFTREGLGTGHIYARAIQRQLPVGPTEVGRFVQIVEGIRGTQIDLAAAEAVGEALLNYPEALECRFLGEEVWRTTLLEVLQVLKSEPFEPEVEVAKSRLSLGCFPDFDNQRAKITVKLLRNASDEQESAEGWAKVGLAKGAFRATFTSGSEESTPIVFQPEGHTEYGELDLLNVSDGTRVQLAFEGCGSIAFALPFFASALNQIRRRKPSIQFVSDVPNVYCFSKEGQFGPQVNASEISRRGDIALSELVPASGVTVQAFAESLGLRVEKVKIQLAAITPAGRMLVGELGIPLSDDARLIVEPAGGTNLEGLPGTSCWIEWKIGSAQADAKTLKFDTDALCWPIELDHAAAILSGDSVQVKVRSSGGSDISAMKEIVRATFGESMPEGLPNGAALLGFQFVTP